VSPEEDFEKNGVYPVKKLVLYSFPLGILSFFAFGFYYGAVQTTSLGRDFIFFLLPFSFSGCLV
jgi:hypothetical protein